MTWSRVYHRTHCRIFSSPYDYHALRPCPSGCAYPAPAISSGYLRIPCPAHGGTNPNLALWVNDDGIAARCHSAGCSYADIAAAIETRYGISINPRRYHRQPHHGGHQGHEHQENTRTRAKSPGPPPLRPSPLAPLSPHSQLIRTPRPAVAGRPSTVAARTTPTRGQCAGSAPNTCTSDFQGAGAIIAMAAPPDAWTTSWPGLPDLSSVQLVYVGETGVPARRPRPDQADLRPRHGRRDRAGMPAPAERGRSGGRRRRAGRRPSPGLLEAPLLQSQPWGPPA